MKPTVLRLQYMTLIVW